ncbi:Nuclear transcription factor Y subunit A-7 [Acorus calamus]|uniref:Nuclear transcription factor Y subunit n=1 Tax=Acorus calamus TaxID=4465 RepID=A0AAV9E771_ACOCL|nr:Nuclear transcription factor Y subunit A-7 [Acorus calamus]
MTSSVQDLSSHSDQGGEDEQPKQSQSEVQQHLPVPGIYSPCVSSPSAEYMIPPAHNMPQATYPYVDHYYGSFVAAYGGQAAIHPHLMGMHHAGVPLPSDAVEEPVYVNAKQYHGILRRRQSRARAESENKLIKSRKPYLHESRHLHAMKRVRGCGGRFLNGKNDEKKQQDGLDKDRHINESDDK